MEHGAKLPTVYASQAAQLSSDIDILLLAAVTFFRVNDCAADIEKL
jgi:hypothetical protein